MSSAAQPIIDLRNWLALKAQQAQTGNLRDLLGLGGLGTPQQAQPDPYHDQQVRTALASFGAKPADEQPAPKSVFALKKGK